MHDDSTLSLNGKLAKKLLGSLKVGQKVSFTVSGEVEELSQRDSLNYALSSEPGEGEEETCYCVRVNVDKVKESE